MGPGSGCLFLRKPPMIFHMLAELRTTDPEAAITLLSYRSLTEADVLDMLSNRRISLFDLSFGRTSLEHTEAFSKKSIFRFYTEITKRPSLKCLFVKLYTTFCEDLEGCGVVYFYLVSVLGDRDLLAATSQWQRICLPLREVCVPSLIWEGPPEKETATHHRERGTWTATVHRVAESQMRLNMHTHTLGITVLL